MKHKKNIAHICLLALFFLVIVMPSLMAQEASLSRYLPAKALVYLESNNLSGQLEKLLKSDFANNFEGTQAYDDFTRSKLYNKLEDRITNLENATGFGINLENLQALAGSNSAFALYDIGEVKFVFITEIGEAKVTASNLWSLKDKFETRKAESLGKDYWVKEEDGGRVSFAFTFHNGFLVAGTDIVNVEKTLELMAGGKENMSSDEGFQQALSPVKDLKEVLLYLDLEKIASTPYWRNYWVYKNQADLETLSKAIITLELKPGEMVEKRYFTSKSVFQAKNDDFVKVVEAQPSSMCYYEFGALDGKRAIQQLEGMFSNTEGKRISALYNAFKNADPLKYSISLGLTPGEEFNSFDFSKYLVIELVNVSGFDKLEFEKQLAAIFETKLLYGEEGLLKFEPEGEFQVLKVPLMDKIQVSYRLNGNLLMITQGLYRQKSSSKNHLVTLLGEQKKAAGFLLDYRASQRLVKYFDVLAKRNNWSSTNNAKYFDVSYSSLLESLQKFTYISKMSEVVDGVLIEEIRY